jgi:hypothetical protein
VAVSSSMSISARPPPASSQPGIVDPVRLANRLAKSAVLNGAKLFLGNKVVNINKIAKNFRVETVTQHSQTEVYQSNSLFGPTAEDGIAKEDTRLIKAQTELTPKLISLKTKQPSSRLRSRIRVHRRLSLGSALFRSGPYKASKCHSTVSAGPGITERFARESLVYWQNVAHFRQ